MQMVMMRGKPREGHVSRKPKTQTDLKGGMRYSTGLIQLIWRTGSELLCYQIVLKTAIKTFNIALSR
jgi:hypothetical protein